MDIVVLAGGKCSPELAELGHTEFRATLPIWGTTFVEIVLDAVRSIGEPILVGGPPGLHRRQVPGGENFIGSLKNGLDAVGSANFLLATADLPFLTTDGARDFIQRCDAQAMLNYPIVCADRPDPRFAAIKRTTIRLREGKFTGGNLALIQTELMRTHLPTMESAYAMRKKPLKLAALVGFGTLFKVAAAQVAPPLLGLKSLEIAVARFLGAPVRAIITPYQEIGMDIDNAEQYKAICGLPRTAHSSDT